MKMRFDEAKATQVASQVLKLRGGRMHYIKLLKILYLIDREALKRWGIPVTTDSYVSMDHGPVVSNIFNLVTDDKPKAIWSTYISAPLGDYEIELLPTAPALSNDRLSHAEEQLIKEVYAEFGYKNRWDIIHNYMHRLPEWKNPNGSSIPIHLREILEAVGEDPEEIRATLRELNTIASAEQSLSPVR
ncbi:MAG TPA: Panacea domain-containing protein [Terriglobia bacterium]|nr:Panacea domain-containing protein [Terriglobia bacterium]